MYKIELKRHMVVGDRFTLIRVSKFRATEHVTFQVLAFERGMKSHTSVYSLMVVSNV